MLKKHSIILAIVMLTSILLVGCGGDKKAATPAANNGKKLIIYTSMKESLIRGIVDGFKKQNPGIEVDYQSAGAGKLMAKIAAERQSGKVLADVIWTSEVPDFYNMKSNHSGLTIISKYKTYQQTTETTCGAAVALMVTQNYGDTRFEELQISDMIGTKHERNANGEIGVGTKQLAGFFKNLGWQVVSSLDTANIEGVSFMNIVEFAKFVQNNLDSGRPIMVENMYWGGHWRIIIGYDTMGTSDLTDDVLIFADPYDTQDHKQDGYTVQTLAGFYYTWKDVDMLPKDQRVQQWIVAKPK